MPISLTQTSHSLSTHQHIKSHNISPAQTHTLYTPSFMPDFRNKYVGSHTTLGERILHHLKSSQDKKKQQWPLYWHFRKKDHKLKEHAKFLALENVPVKAERDWTKALNTLQPSRLNISPDDIHLPISSLGTGPHTHP